MKTTLADDFGSIDIYLFDQLLKGRYNNCKTVLDAGCGYGRNIVYFLKNNFEVFGIDEDADAISQVKKLSVELSPENNLQNFKVDLIENMPHANASFDLVICSAVLHFAKNKDHFHKMLNEIWRVLKPGGYLFVRLASNIGIETLVKDLGDGRYFLPDGSERFLVTEKMLMSYTSKLNGELYEYIKTTNVQNLRCMTTWCLKKKG